MFNTKLKMEIKQLKSDNGDLEQAICDMGDQIRRNQRMKEILEKEIEKLKEVVEAQGLLCAVFAGHILAIEKQREEAPKKRGTKKGFKRKAVVKKGKPGPKPKKEKILKKGKKHGKKKA